MVLSKAVTTIQHHFSHKQEMDLLTGIFSEFHVDLLFFVYFIACKSFQWMFFMWKQEHKKYIKGEKKLGHDVVI